MSHGGPGYYYYRCSYRCKWTNPTNNTNGESHDWAAGVFSEIKKQTHEGQKEWTINRALPSIREDIQRWYQAVDANKDGKIFERFKESNIIPSNGGSKYCQSLPLKNGKPHGKEIRP